MRVWITGICGLIGSHLFDELFKRGHKVKGNDNLSCGSMFNVLNSPRGQVDVVGFYSCQDPELVRAMKDFKPDVVIHCAATAAEGLSVFSPHFITKNIYEASVATFSAAIASGAKRIVNMSSMARYGKGRLSYLNAPEGTNHGPPFNETAHVPAPIDPYGIAKVAAEDTLKVLCETHGVKWTTLVPHNVIGPRQQITPYRNVATIFLNRLKLGLPVYIYGDGEQKRCFSPIKDCLHSLVRAVEGDCDGQVVNIGPDGGEITINKLLDMCEEIVGVKAERVYMPPRPVTDKVKEAYCSADKARRLLGYEPQDNLMDCLQEMSDAMTPKPFNYNFPIEIREGCPETWLKEL